MASDDKKTDDREKQKLHVDADWKAEAQAEKERLAEDVERGSAEQQPTGPEQRPLPQPTFTLLVQSLATQALLFMSDERDPETGRSIRNLEVAKHNIDLLEVLEEKTKGNLTEEEKKMLDTLLYQVRMAYVTAAR